MPKPKTFKCQEYNMKQPTCWDEKFKTKQKKSASKEFRKKVKYLFCYIQDTLSLKKDTELCYYVSGSALYCFMVFIRAQFTEM